MTMTVALDLSIKFILFVLSIWRIQAQDNTLSVNTTILESAVANGAVCLDGSPPAFLFHEGTGLGVRNWVIHLEGGGWCSSVQACLDRTNSPKGSSKLMKTFYTFSGILSNISEENPAFYNWNKVFVKYCDGSSFTGDVEEVDSTTNLHFRGARIFKAIMEELLAKGMYTAQNAILSGTSAGGLGAILNCDKFRALLPYGATVKCISASGFFVDVNTIANQPAIEEKFKELVVLHGSIKSLPQACTSTLLRPSLCFFPEHAAQHIATPLFIVNSAYDSFQVNNILVPNNSDPFGIWDSCKNDIRNCSYSQLNILHEFRLRFLRALNRLGRSYSRGYFITSCYSRSGIENQTYWLSHNSPILYNKVIGRAVGEWFYDISGFQHTDCPYPCGQEFCH